MTHHARIKDGESAACGQFSRVVVSDFRPLRRDIVFGSLLARQSPAAKIPFQTRRRKKMWEEARCFSIPLPGLNRRSRSTGSRARSLWSLLGDIVSQRFFSRLSPAAKIPFQTRTGPPPVGGLNFVWRSQF